MIRNVHARRVSRDPVWLAHAIDTIAERDGLWPSDTWPALRLDAPLGVGAGGGHGPIRYHVTGYEPGRRLSFEFEPPTKLRGTHTFELIPESDTGFSTLRHQIDARAVGMGLLSWPLAIRWLHDALLEDLLDRIEYPADEQPTPGARWSPWVRALRRLMTK